VVVSICAEAAKLQMLTRARNKYFISKENEKERWWRKKAVNLRKY
jgi:hypothetical protein